MKSAPIHDKYETTIAQAVDCPHCNLEQTLHKPTEGDVIKCPNCRRRFMLKKNPDDVWNKYKTEYKPIKRKSV